MTKKLVIRAKITGGKIHTFSRFFFSFLIFVLSWGFILCCLYVWCEKGVCGCEVINHPKLFLKPTLLLRVRTGRQFEKIKSHRQPEIYVIKTFILFSANAKLIWQVRLEKCNCHRLPISVRIFCNFWYTFICVTYAPVGPPKYMMQTWLSISLLENQLLHHSISLAWLLYYDVLPNTLIPFARQPTRWP